MMPNNALSTTVMFAPFLAPDDIPADPTIDYEMGGIGLSDADQGLLIQVWTATLVGTPGDFGTSVWISAPNTPSTQLFAYDGISEISLAFDQNMHPCIAFMAAGRARIWWYNATIPGYEFVLLADGAKSPKATLDDKRPLATLTASSDIIVAYIYAGDLMMVIQRERFLTPHTLMVNVDQVVINPSVNKIAMTKNNRVQILIAGNLYQ